MNLILELAHWAEDVSRKQRSDLMGLLNIPEPRKQSRRFEKLTGIEANYIDCCVNNCIAFTGEYSELSECPLCGEERFEDFQSKKPWKTFAHIPLIPRLRLQYRDASRADVLKGYRESLAGDSSGDQVQDFFDGLLFREFHQREMGLFSDPHDVALHLSLDTVQLPKVFDYEITPVILLNLNLPPNERYKVDNILASLLIPGPKKPKLFDSFLRPLVDEMVEMGDGVPALDGRTLTSFDLRAWITMVTGGGPALADAIGMKRPGHALRPCRTCLIEAESAGRTYYVPHSSYDFNNPPLRSGFREAIQLVEETDSEEDRRVTGISRSSILLELRSVHFPRSFPADIMQLVLRNITPTLSALWNRTKLSCDEDNRQPYHLNRQSVKAINSALFYSRTHVPADLDAPRRVNKRHKGDKATEWEAWLKWFGLPLLDQRLNDQYLDNFRILGQIYTLATRHSLCQADIELLDSLVIGFVRSYEQLYLGTAPNHDPQRLPVCSVNIHYLLHLPTYIRDCGPARYRRQCPMERFCDAIMPTQSKSRLSSRLANKLVLTEHINHVRFTQQGRAGIKHLVYPALQERYNASLTQSQRLCLESECGDVEEIQFYERCQVRDDLTVGSLASERQADDALCDFRVCYTGPGDDGMKFGLIHYFLRVSSTGRPVQQLAQIRQFEDVKIDRETRIASFGGKKGHRSWVDVKYIHCLIGIVKDRGLNFIVTDVDLFG